MDSCGQCRIRSNWCEFPSRRSYHWCGEWKEREPASAPRLLSIRLDNSERSGRVRRVFLRLGLRTVADLIALTPDDLLAQKNFGLTSLREVQRWLAAMGLCLKDDLYGARILVDRAAASHVLKGGCP